MTFVLYSIMLFIVLLLAGAGLYNFFRPDQQKKIKDARQYLRPNATNYNIASHHPELIENATPEEAREILEKVKKGQLPSLSNEDFYLLKEKLSNTNS